MKWALSLIGIGLAFGTVAFADVILPAAAASRVLFIGFLSSGALALAIAILDLLKRDEDGFSDASEGARQATEGARQATAYASRARAADAVIYRRGSNARQDSSMPPAA